ncbi:MAG: nucleotidyltransferase [Nitrospirota bacterium]|nr:nucleotidyltransferase [Nitrospirota bacterium]
MNGLYEFYTALKEATSRTVNSAFETFIDNEINIPKGIRAIASTSQKHLREFLSSEEDRDDAFPRVLLIEDNDFLGGSFARHTKIWPLDDIDIYIPLDGHSLFYSEWGMVQPYTVVSDDILTSNPLLKPRWMKGQYISSQKLISEFATVLNRHYPNQTKIKPNRQAVSIRMTHGETNSGDGLGYDVVPCFSMKPHNNTELPFYLMPNGNDGWIRTNPRCYECNQLVVCFMYFLIQSNISQTNSQLSAKIVTLMIVFFIAGDFASHYISYSGLSKISEVILNKCDKLRNDQAIDINDIIRAMNDYNCALIKSPPIPDFIYKRDQDKLNKAWRAHRKERD